MKRWTNLSLVFCALAASIFMVGCKPEKQDDYAEKILGRWEIREGLRNGEATESLSGLFFEFQAGGAMRTNLSGAEETAAYELKENQILQRQSQIEADYTIEEITDSTLTLSTKLRSYNFRFMLGKAAAPTQ